MNMGTKINELIKSQGFDHYAYPGRTSSYSTKTGLQIMMFAYTDNATHFNIDLDETGDYTISIGLKPVHQVVSTNVPAEKLAEIFMQEIDKVKKTA